MKAFLHTRMPHQAEAMRALALGLDRHGIETQISDNAAGANDADFVVWWGDHVPHYLKSKPRLILEAGYINGKSGNYVRDRLRFVSAGWNGLHGRADAVTDCPSDRWQSLGIELQPWRFGGPLVLICDQHPGDSVAPKDHNWWREVRNYFEDYGVAIRYRPHPLMRSDQPGLEHDLADARLCVTWSSSAAVEAVVRGVPTLALDRGSIAWPVSSHRLTDAMYTPDREQWAYDLAYRQWTHHELADGTAWEHIWRDDVVTT